MNPVTRKRRSWSRAGMQCTTTAFALIAAGTMLNGQEPTRGLSAPRAAMALTTDGAYDFRGQTIRCSADQQVGIGAENRQYLNIANVAIENCAIGIMVSTSTVTKTAPGVRESQMVPIQPPSLRVSGVKVQATTVGMLLSGSHSTISGNIAGGSEYGIVITGDDNTVTGNSSNDNSEDGILVTGDRNILEGNQTLRNGGAGIRIASMIPMVGDYKFLYSVRDRGVGNIVRGNTATNNGQDLVEFGACQPPPFDPLPNLWTGNVFGTQSPSCIQ